MVIDDIFFCRHGQTEYNAQDRLQGRREVPLNALGRSQAKRNGAYLFRRLGERARDFRFLASPMDRAQETMRIIRTQLRLDPAAFETDERLMEVGYGDWEGPTIPEVASRDPQAVVDREADKWNYRCPGANSESYAELLTRIEPLLEELTARTIIVSHGGVGRAVLRGVGKISEDDAAMTIVPQDRILTFDDSGPRWV